MFLERADVTVEGEYHIATNVPIRKRAGTLDVELSARELGIDYDATIALRGRSLGAGRVEWTFDHRFTPALDLGGIRVGQVTGTLIGRIQPRYGTTPSDALPSSYSVNLESAPGGSIVIRGEARYEVLGITGWHGFERTVDRFSFRVASGKPQPQLSSVQMLLPRDGICSSWGDRPVMGAAVLAGTAPAGGTWIDVFTSVPSRFPHQRVLVPAGSRLATFRLTVPRAFSGTIMVGAASGGARQGAELRVKDCLPRIDASIRLESDGILNCPSCVSTFERSELGATLIASNGSYAYVPPKGAASALDDMLGGKVEFATMNGFGDIAGRVLRKGEKLPTGFVLRQGPDGAKPETVDGFDPLRMDDFGTVYGNCRTDALNGLCLYNHEKLRDLGVKGDVVQVVGALANGDVLANSVYWPPNTNLTNAIIRSPVYTPIRSTLKENQALAALPGGSSGLFGVNAAGVAAGWSLTKDGRAQAVVYLPGKEAPQPLYTPDGWQTFAVGVTEDGVAFGNAIGPKGEKVPLQWSLNPGQGPVVYPVTVEGVKGLEVLEVLSLTRSGHILARARVNQVESTVILRRDP
jgi:hypothetical protein